MSGYNELKNAIRRVVKTNNNREITGQNLQSTLTSMVNSLGANYHFAGFASPGTNPGTPDQNIFYIASEEGTYVNFDGINLEPGLSFLMWNGKWSSETISVGEVTKSWVQQNYVSIAFFNELFELYNDSTKIAVNDTIPVDKDKLNIKAMFGFWTEQYISALGKNDSGGSGSGVDMATVWSALAGSTDEQINKSHLTTALSEYATQSWVSQIFATIASIPTKLSQLANDTGFITSAALPTKVSQLVNDAGYVTASIVNGYATQSWVSQIFATIASIPTKLSQLANDTGFITSAALPTKVSQLVNDSGYVTSSIVDGYATQSWVSQIFATITSIPTKLSQLANDTGFITSAALPTKVSQLSNDSGYITSSGSCAYAASAGNANNADKLNGLGSDDILPYGLENLFAGVVKAGGNTTLNADGSITTHGVNADTYFYFRCTEDLIAGEIYTFGFYVTGVPSENTSEWSFLLNNYAENLAVKIKSNGWCWGTGTINYNVAAGKDILFDDYNRGFYNSINISKFVIVKGRQKAYYTPPISQMSVASATKLQTARTIWGQSFDGTQDVNGDLILPNGKKIVIGGASLSWDAYNNAVKIDGSVYATGGVSALGKNDSGGSGSGVDMATVWSALAGSTDEQINESHLTTALSEYATQSWVSQIFATTTSIPTKLSQLANDIGFITSSALPTKLSQLANDTGFITHQDISGKADRSELSQYLPLTGGTMTGNIRWSGATREILSFAPSDDSWKGGLKYSWANKTTIALWGKNTMAQFVWNAGVNASSTDIDGYATRTYDFQVGRNSSNVLEAKVGGNVIWHKGNLTNVSQLTNDAGYVTASIVNGYATQSWVNTQLGDYLPLSGGTISSSSVDSLHINSTANSSYIDFRSNNNIKCYVGYDVTLCTFLQSAINNYPALGLLDDGTPYYRPNIYKPTRYELIHAGNIGSQSVNYATSAGYADSAAQVTNSLSWSGYSSGSYNGSTVQSISIPNNTNQLVNGAGYITSSASITGNAATATKLQTTRTLWGQSFDGSANVSGDMTGVGSIYASGNINASKDLVTNQYLRINAWSGYGTGYTDVWYDNTSNNQLVNWQNCRNMTLAGNHVWHAGNDGSGSGLDADLLDGQEGSYYAKATDVTTLQGYFTNGVANNTTNSVYTNYMKCYYDGKFHTENRIYANWINNRYELKEESNNYNVYVSLSGRADSATTLATARTIWGQRFDGTSNVDGNLSCNGQGSFNSLHIGNITIIYDAANKGLRIAGGGLYTDSYLSSLGVDASTALSVKKWVDSINLTEESDAELATAYSIGNLYRLINSNQESITQSLNQSVVTLQGRCTSLEQRVSALENKVNK